MWQPLLSDEAEKADGSSKSNQNNNTNISDSQVLEDVLVDDSSTDLTAPTSPIINVDYVGKRSELISSLYSLPDTSFLLNLI